MVVQKVHELLEIAFYGDYPDPTDMNVKSNPEEASPVSQPDIPVTIAGLDEQPVMTIDSMYMVNDALTLAYSITGEDYPDANKQVYTIDIEITSDEKEVYSMKENYRMKELKGRAAIDIDFPKKIWKNNSMYNFLVIIIQGNEVLEEKEFRYLYTKPLFGRGSFEPW
jgi:hypothetical protein